MTDPIYKPSPGASDSGSGSESAPIGDASPDLDGSDGDDGSNGDLEMPPRPMAETRRPDVAKGGEVLF
jgi:hypothetical protein